MEGNQTSVIESSDCDIKKLMTSAIPESTKKSPKYYSWFSRDVRKKKN